MRKRRIILHILANFIAVPNRHENVRENQIRLYIGNFANSGLAVANGNDVDPLILQGQSHHLLDVAVIVRNKNLRHRSSANLSAVPWANLPGDTVPLSYWSIRGRV